MKLVKILLSLIIVIVMGWLSWNYFAGPLRYQREMHAFADALEACEAFSAPVFMYVGGQSLQHSVDGAENGKCGMRMQTPGPIDVHCAFAIDQLPLMAQGFRNLADAVDIFGDYEFRYDSSNPDPLTEALNSDACEHVSR